MLDIGRWRWCCNSPYTNDDPPHVTLYHENDLELGKPNTLICFIDGFHPAAIKVTWTKNTLPVTEGVTLTQYYPNTDFTLNMFSYLSFTPELGDVYSCQVQHSALSETLTTFWGLIGLYGICVNENTDGITESKEY
ncbi:UNVERIFIED_CONTAM: hypothetical protein FKN15_003217 [Acipenser sinensis]